MECKNILILGAGAQGSMIAQRLDEEPTVEKIVCADYNYEAAKNLETRFRKIKAVKVDAKNDAEVVALANGMDLLVSALPPDFNVRLMKAALAGNLHYQDMASGPIGGIPFVDTVKQQLALDEEFKAKGLTALINTGSAPGIANVVARQAADKMDSCERLEIFFYDGIWTNKFIPFWWSPETAFGDMAAEPIIFENGEYKQVLPFANSVEFEFKGLGKRRVVDHEHEEPVTFPMFFKDLKYAGLKYGGPAMELAENLHKMGLLSREPVKINGGSVVPFDLVCQLTPPAPADENAIIEALSEGMVSEEGAFLIRAEGVKDGAPVRIDSYVNAPGLIECFEKHKTTHESFITGQAAFLFTKLFVLDKLTATGVYPPEVLIKSTRDFYLNEAANLGITVDEFTETLID